MAQWFETYVASFDLNFWTGTEFLGASRDESGQRWEVRLRGEDGTERLLHPAHIVMATGSSNVPIIPDLPGLADFGGELTHAADFQDGNDYRGKRVLVIGTGTSAHDFALDIVRSGGAATMVQRGPVIVIDLPTANTLYGDYNDREVPTSLVDLRFLAGSVFHQQRQGFIEFQKFAEEADHELHAKLRKAGLRVWSGEDATGFYYSYLSKSKGGFYINVGASDAIVNGEIGVIQLSDVDHFDRKGIVLVDGSTQAYDAVVFATAYESQTAFIENAFGSEFLEQLGPVWGFGTDGEMRNVLKPTVHQGFWILDGSIPMARWHSPLVALLIKADLIGAVPNSFTAAGHPSRTPAEPVPALDVAFRARAMASGAPHHGDGSVASFQQPVQASV